MPLRWHRMRWIPHSPPFVRQRCIWDARKRDLRRGRSVSGPQRCERCKQHDMLDGSAGALLEAEAKGSRKQARFRARHAGAEWSCGKGRAAWRSRCEPREHLDGRHNQAEREGTASRALDEASTALRPAD